jgi:hypothetical protein
MLWALAPIMVPTKARADAAIMNLVNISDATVLLPQYPYHLLPNMSDSRPTSVKPMAKPAVHEMPTQMMFGDGPIAASMSVRVFAGKTHPK